MKSTHNLMQYAITIGRKCYLYKRNNKKGINGYTKPNLVGIKWFRSGTEASRYEQEYDRPLVMH